MIRDKIEEVYGFHISVFVINLPKVRQIIANNPFTEADGYDAGHQYITLLSEVPERGQINSLEALDIAPEAYVLRGHTLYFYAPNGYGRAKLNNNFIENKLHVRATTRNWKTMNVLLEMCHQ